MIIEKTDEKLFLCNWTNENYKNDGEEYWEDFPNKIEIHTEISFREKYGIDGKDITTPDFDYDEKGISKLWFHKVPHVDIDFDRIMINDKTYIVSENIVFKNTDTLEDVFKNIELHQRIVLDCHNFMITRIN